MAQGLQFFVVLSLTFYFQTVSTSDMLNVFVTFGHPHLSTSKVIQEHQTRKFANRAQSATSLVTDLKTLATGTQSNLVQFLETTRGQRSFLSVTSFWITNQLFIQGATSELVQILRSFEGVTKVQEEPNYYLDAPQDLYPTRKPADDDVQWGIAQVEAPGAWSSPNGNDGSGVIVGTMDTGARVTHEALADNYVGEYGWFDPYKNETTPVDASGHGTHTLGTIVGSRGIGVAPGATWMTCRACYGGFCSADAMLGCGQFLLCPTDPLGQNEDCSRAPHVISNSFGGGQGRDLLWPVFDAWKAAGIIIIFSNGNSGPFCGTANSHADAPQVIGVGGTDINDNLYVRTSIGPSVYGTLKPDIAAPGVDVISAYHTGDDIYYKMSGTSMAAPHVAGAVAILLADTPGMTHQEVLDILAQSAERELGVTGKNCGGIPEDVFPNHTYGHGRINVLRALKMLKERKRRFEKI